MIVVNEIFFSIQGESGYAGHPCVFVRLAYCNLRCTYCDTQYAYTEGTEMGVEEVVEKIKIHGCKLVEITGGEPLLQVGVYPLMKHLCDDDFCVLLETGGSVDISNVDPRVKRIIDIKCPSSGMSGKNFWENLYYLKSGDELKFVIGDEDDYNWAKSIIKKHHLDEKIPVIMSCVFGKLEARVLAEWILKDKLNVRFQLQMHKYIWDPERKSV